MKTKEVELKRKVIIGYVGRDSVKAIEYPRKDSGLSHYYVNDGPAIMGTVEFTLIEYSYFEKY